VVKELGDGLLLWFPEAIQAIHTSLALQDRFEEEADRTMLPIWVRMGSHWGHQVLRRGDVIGHDVNVAARIVTMAAPGEVLISEATLDAARAGLGSDVACEELGPVVMKGIPEAVRLYRVSRSFDFNLGD
jgi:adenylate cyclase